VKHDEPDGSPMKETGNSPFVFVELPTVLSTKTADSDDDTVYGSSQQALPHETLELGIWSPAPRKPKPLHLQREGLPTAVDRNEIEVIPRSEGICHTDCLTFSPALGATALTPLNLKNSVLTSRLAGASALPWWVSENPDLRM
jgi:hypothetical protein